MLFPQLFSYLLSLSGVSLNRSLEEVQNSDGGLHSKELGSILASFPATQGSILSLPPKKFVRQILNVIEANQWHWLEDSGQWLEKVLASGKPDL